MTCKTCTLPAVGKSKYCSTHRAEARKAFKSMIAEQSEERAQREEQFAAAFKAAHEAGQIAADSAIPAPMVVAQHSSPLDDRSPVTDAWYVSEGVCGYAWITIRPGNSALANYAKKHYGARKAYYGGVEIWVSGYGQSMQRKEAYAQAFARTLTDLGYPKVSAGSRMD